MFTQFTIHEIHALKLFQEFFFINYLIFHFLKNSFFYTPFTPFTPWLLRYAMYISALHSILRDLKTPPFHPLFTPFSSPPRHGFKAGRETTWWCFRQPISPPSSSAAPQTAGEAAWGFSLLSSSLCGGKAVPRVVERRWVYELYVVRLVRVAS